MIWGGHKVFTLVFDNEDEASTAKQFFAGSPDYERILFLWKSAPETAMILV